MSLITMKLIGIEIPILLPLVLVVQSLLVGFIQAFVFPLLITIFIRIATE
ncbi:MAG: hypothetical protein H6766_08050 [Candidatus Peribacteria bacterium]|nr:MAG: hypothetical protein H6766_08050 [Candidatus Peribacteria bacterium]